MDDRLAELSAKVGRPSLLHRLPRLGVKAAYNLRTQGAKVALAWQGGRSLAAGTGALERERLDLVREVVATKVSLRTLVELQRAQDGLDVLYAQARDLRMLLWEQKEQDRHGEPGEHR